LIGPKSLKSKANNQIVSKAKVGKSAKRAVRVR